MKIFFIILGVICGIVLLFCILRFFVGAAVNNNPVDSITPYGTFGFKLGDAQSTVIRRLKLVKLISKEELEEFREDEEFNKEINGGEYGLPLDLYCAENQFGHIKNLCFTFKNRKLSNISILFDKTPEEIPDFMEIVEYRVSQRLGKPTFKEKNIVKWGEDISLYASLDENPEENKVLQLFIGLTN